jgi:hypothetical protein
LPNHSKYARKRCLTITNLLKNQLKGKLFRHSDSGLWTEDKTAFTNIIPKKAGMMFVKDAAIGQ